MFLGLQDPDPILAMSKKRHKSSNSVVTFCISSCDFLVCTFKPNSYVFGGLHIFLDIYFTNNMAKYLSLIFLAVMKISTIQDNLFDPETHSEQQRQIEYRMESITRLP